LLSEVDLSDRLVVVVECFRSLCAVSPPYRLYFVRPLVRQNRPGGGDSAHFENHCSGR